MEKLKLFLLLAIFATAGYGTVRYIHETAIFYRNMMEPEDTGDKVEIVPPIVGQLIALTVPLRPPTGEPRDDEMWDFDIPEFILNERIATMSNTKTVYYFFPERCLKCHEEEGPGQNFYGNENYTEIQDIKTEDGLLLHSYIEKGEVPTTEYIYKDRHLKKVPFDIGAPHEIYMTRGY